jgi:hypothetical protein
MKITVPDEVLKQTTQCPNKFSCLTTGSCGKFPACSVKTSYKKLDMFSVKSKNIINISLCPYELSFAREYICQCPTHAALIKELEKNKSLVDQAEIKENTAAIPSEAISTTSSS